MGNEMAPPRQLTMSVASLMMIALILAPYIARTLDELIVVETYSPGSVDGEIIRVVDGDTVEAYIGDRLERIRIVGYDAWELREPGGAQARSFLAELCSGADVKIDVDDLEPRDKYGRLLAYMWCGRSINGYMAYASVSKAFLAGRPDLVDRPLYIEPDEYPYIVWLLNHEVELGKTYSVVLINTSTLVDGSIYRYVGDKITLTGGFYRIYIAGKETALLELASVESVSIDIGDEIRSESVKGNAVEGYRDLENQTSLEGGEPYSDLATVATVALAIAILIYILRRAVK